MKVSLQPEKQEQLKTLVSILYRMNNLPVELSKGQLDIFHAITNPLYTRVNIISSTQYGKSFTVALAVLYLTCIMRKTVAIVAPTTAKAKLIMRYYIHHLEDSILFYGQLEKDDKLDRLKQEESKMRITLKDGGCVYVISAQEHKTEKSIEAAMGEGADVVVLDEGGLVRNETEATIFRMIAGRGKLAKYVKIGNPFYRNHFYSSSEDPKYLQIFIDYHQAIKEGRYDEEFIEEAKGKPLFNILYACEFPDEDLMDERGYIKLFTSNFLKEAIKQNTHRGRLRLGIDAGAGGDSTVYTLRSDTYAEVLEENNVADLMQQAKIAIAYIRQLLQKEPDLEIYIDDTGVGEGLSDRLTEEGFNVIKVKVGSSPSEPDRFANVKAENFMEAYSWVFDGGRLSPQALRNNDKLSYDKRMMWFELSEVKYRETSSSKIQIEPKEELKKRGIKSYNVADSFMLTFTKPKPLKTESNAYGPVLLFSSPNRI